MAKEKCDAKRCRQEASIAYAFGSNTYRLCDTHNAEYCRLEEVPGTQPEDNIRKVVK